MPDASDAKRDFFVSFNQADRVWATWIVWVLEEAKYSVLFQDWDFRGSFIEQMHQAVSRTERTLVVLSDNYLASEIARSEAWARLAEDPVGRDDLVITVKVGPVTELGLFNHFAYTELATCDEDEARQRLLERVKQAVDPTYRPQSGSRPGFPSTIPRQVIGKPRFPIAEHNLPRPIQSFVGREAELAGIAEALAASGRTAITQPRALTGLGGIGKTQLALRYAYAHLGDYDLIRWLRAEEPATLAADFAGMAAALGLDPETPDQAALVAAIRSALERRERFLLVFDNATAPASLDSYLPRSGGGHVLITSRLRTWKSAAKILELEVLPESEAVAVLVKERVADATERAAAATLANELGRLPLALNQAWAFMDARGIGVDAYRQQLATRRPQVTKWRPRDADYPLSVAQAWQASIDHAATDCPAARELLQLLAFFAPDAIPRDLLAALPEALPEGLRDDFDRDTAIEALTRFSLLRADPATLTLHRLVQAVTRDTLDEATTKARAESAVRLAAAALPRSPQEHSNWLATARLLPHTLVAVEAAENHKVGLEAATTLLNQTALYYMGRAVWTECEPLLKRAISALGSEPGGLASALNNLGYVYLATGRYAEAEPLFKRAIGIGEKTLGPEHPDLAMRLNNLANLYWNTGRYADAEPLYQRAIAIGEKMLGPEDRDVASWLNNLAALYQATGRYTKAEELYRRAVLIGEKTLGPEHPDLATWLNNLAELYRATRRYAEAEPLIKRAIAIGEKTLGPEHHDLASSLNNMANLYSDTGRSVEAERLHRRANIIVEETLGPEHPGLAVGLNNLAEHYRETGRHAEAEPLYQRAIAIIAKALPIDHPDQALFRKNYAILLDALGRTDEAADLRAQAAPSL